jgi:hypothetical protein
MQHKYPSVMSLVMTAVVALVLFAGTVMIAKRLPVTEPVETMGSAPARDLATPKVSDSVPARPAPPRDEDRR